PGQSGDGRRPRLNRVTRWPRASAYWTWNGPVNPVPPRMRMSSGLAARALAIDVAPAAAGRVAVAAAIAPSLSRSRRVVRMRELPGGVGPFQHRRRAPAHAGGRAGTAAMFTGLHGLSARPAALAPSRRHDAHSRTAGPTARRIGRAGIACGGAGIESDPGIAPRECGIAAIGGPACVALLVDHLPTPPTRDHETIPDTPVRPRPGRPVPGLAGPAGQRGRQADLRPGARRDGRRLGVEAHRRIPHRRW